MKKSMYLSAVAAMACSACSHSGAVLRKEFTHEAVVQGRPEKVFPLLCPIREVEWIEDWKANVLFAKSGVAEDNGVFATNITVLGETWVTTRYEPENFRVEYTIFAGGHAILRFDLALVDRGDGTSLWRTKRTYTGLDWMGRLEVDKATKEKIDREEDLLAKQLNHFLINGTMLKGK